MSFEDSRNAELLIAPLAEKIMSDPNTAKVFDVILGGSEGKTYGEMTNEERLVFVKKRVDASKELTRRLIHDHFEETCEIAAILNSITVAEIKGWKRSEMNAQIGEIIQDGDMQSFFMSSDALVLAVLSDISQASAPSLQEQASDT